MVSLSEIEAAFFNHCADAGVIFTEPLIADGKLHRVHVEGDKRGTKNGAYILHADGNPSGWFQHFKTGISGNWNMSGKREPMSSAMRQQIEADKQRWQIEQQLRHKDASDKARVIWHNATTVYEQGQHPYLINKNIQPHRLRMRGDALVVPIWDEAKQLVNLQFIQPNGTKRFLTGGRKKGCFSTIGRYDEIGIIQITEGYSTGASVHEVTGNLTVVALDAGNLESVALAVRRVYSTAPIIIFGDNDESGVGQRAARAAALACGGKYMIPDIVGNDWNDTLNREAAQ